MWVDDPGTISNSILHLAPQVGHSKFSNLGIFLSRKKSSSFIRYDETSLELHDSQVTGFILVGLAYCVYVMLAPQSGKFFSIVLRSCFRGFLDLTRVPVTPETIRRNSFRSFSNSGIRSAVSCLNTKLSF